MLNTARIVPRWVVITVDLIICGLTLVFAYFLKDNLSFAGQNLNTLSGKVVVLMLVSLAAFLFFRTDVAILHYTGLQDSLQIFYAVLSTTTILFFYTRIASYLGSTFTFPTVVLIIHFLTSFLFLTSYRVLVKFAVNYQQKNQTIQRKNVVIYGAGEAGFATKRVLERDRTSNVHIVCFLDDDLRKVNKAVDGVRIAHTNDLQRIVETENIEEVIFAAFAITPEKKNAVVDFCLDHDIKVLNVPPLDRWINGRFSAIQLQTIRIENLLEREPISISNDNIAEQIRGKKIIVTGAAGSIGSEIVRQLIKFHPGMLILCDQAETPLYQLELELRDTMAQTPCVFFLGDITDTGRMDEVFNLYKPQYVYHAAAYKHVPMMELSPSEAILTNAMGTKIMADLSVRYRVEKFVMVSTDKAVNPTNVMGASKRMAEIYVQSLHHLSGSKEDGAPSTKFITTRFGNVLGSNGSVINTFKEQIEKGGPVTVTHPQIIRFFMTIPEACQLVLEAGSMGQGGEIFAFDMGKPVSIAEMARKMIRLYGLVPEVDIPIVYTGLRPGEKLYEEVLNDSENTLPTYHEKIMIAKIRDPQWEEVKDSFENIIRLARERRHPTELVKLIAVLVPEFASSNPAYGG